MIWQYENAIVVTKLKEAWSYAQKEFASLRLRFDWSEELIQIIDKDGNLDWRYIDLSYDQDLKNQQDKINNIQENDRCEHYKLNEGNLFKVYLLKLKDDLYTCIFSSHHAILDGWSISILLKYIHETYLKLLNNEEIVTKDDFDYKYIQKYLQEHQEDSKEYWNNYTFIKFIFNFRSIILYCFFFISIIFIIAY
jgi:hypothetical protein